MLRFIIHFLFFQPLFGSIIRINTKFNNLLRSQGYIDHKSFFETQENMTAKGKCF